MNAKNTFRILLAAACVLLIALPAFSQSLSGTITGTVKDEQGGVLPGATVTCTGKTGSRTTVSDASGEYRFLALEPGRYSIQAELDGFSPRRQEDIVVSIARQAEVHLTLPVGGKTETIEVLGEAPVVDTTSSATDNALSQDILFNLPIRPTNAAVTLMNYLPGINLGSAYGSDSDTANGLLLDGVDTRDPEGGSAWTFFNFNIVEEVQVSGLGAPAEFGSFTGAVVNTITKSGGNRFGGLFDVYYTNDSLAGDNVPDSIKALNPSLEDPAKTTKLLDFTAQLSGPIIKDKLFFFASAQRFKRVTDPSGPVTVRDEVSPRLNFKLTYQPNPDDSVTGMFQIDDYNVIGRIPGYIPFTATDELTNREDAPEKVWGLQWRHLFGSNTFSEIKYNGWTGYYDLNPETTAPAHYDAATNTYFNSQGWFYYADRNRHQVNASITHYAEAFGKHDLKFGVEVERSKVRSRYGYLYDIWYYDYSTYYPIGQYTAYNYGYDIEGKNERESVFAQDRWQVNDRLTINVGARLDWVRGKPAGVSSNGPRGTETVYDLKNLAPRLGFAYDLTGDSKTVFKGSYSQYYEGAFFLAWSSAIPGIEDFVLTFWDPEGTDLVGPEGNTFTEYARNVTPIYQVDPDIKHPRVDEITVGLERAITNDIRLSLTGIWREDKNLQGTVIPGARWAPVEVTNDLTGEPFTVYEWVNQDESENDKLVTNPDGFQYLDADGNVIGTADASRRYRGIMAVIDKRFTNRWLGRISYVLSKAEGTQDNDGFDTYGSGTRYESASRALINQDGTLTNDRRHELKVMLGYQIPVVDVAVNGFFQMVSGRNYAPYERYGSSTINGFSSSGREIFLEPRGSRRYDTRKLLDLRFEKIFQPKDSNDRFSVWVDIENVFNDDAVTSVVARVPGTSISLPEPTGSVFLDFETPQALVAPRQISFGARWQF